MLELYCRCIVCLLVMQGLIKCILNCDYLSFFSDIISKYIIQYVLRRAGII